MPWAREAVTIDGHGPVAASVRRGDGRARMEVVSGRPLRQGAIVLLADGSRWIAVTVRKPAEFHELGLHPQPEDGPKPRHVGGGVYELPDGTRVRGREAAYAAFAVSDGADPAGVLETLTEDDEE